MNLLNFSAIIFIDEIDAIATKRFDAQTGYSLLLCFLLICCLCLGADRKFKEFCWNFLIKWMASDVTVNVKVILIQSDITQ